MLAIFLATALVAQPNDAIIESDFKCAVAATWALSWLEEGSKAQANVREVDVYYLGKLNGEDPNAQWYWLIDDEFKNRREKNEEIYRKQLDACTFRMSDETMPKKP